MAVMERDVVLQSVDGQGRPTIDLPITRLGNVEDDAGVMEAVAETDYFPVMDSGDGGQMKKAPLSLILGPLAAARNAAEMAQAAAEGMAAMEQVDAAIQEAVLDSWEGSY